MLVCVLAPATIQARGVDEQFEPREGIEHAADFKRFPVHFAGESVGDLTLEAVLGGPEKRSTHWSFIYDDGKPELGSAPLEVQTWSTCERYRDVYPGRQTSFQFRGAQASRDGGGDLEIYTGRVTIVIFGEDRIAERAAQAVRKVDKEPPGRLERPAKGSLSGRLACQR